MRIKRTVFDSLRQSVFARIILAFFVIGITLYSGGLLVIRLALRETREYATQSTIASLREFLIELEVEFDRIRTLELTLVTDSDLERLAAIPDSLSDLERTLAINRVRRQLSLLSLASDYIEDTVVHIPAINRDISAIHSIDDLDVARFRWLAGLPTNKSVDLVYDDGFLIIRSGSQGWQIDPEPPRFLIEVSIDERRIIEVLNRTERLHGRSAILLSPVLDLRLDVAGDPIVDDRLFDELADRAAGSIEGWFLHRLEQGEQLITYATSPSLGMIYANAMDPTEVFRSIRVYRYWFWGLTMTLIGVIVLFGVVTRRAVHRPLVELVGAFGEVEAGNYEVRVGKMGSGEFGYLFRGFNSMVDRLNVLIDQVLKQKILAQHSELKQLQSQINPHFLYNSFFILHSMVIQGDMENLERFSKQLGTYYRFLTRSASSEIDLGSEVAHARTYADIQAHRFRNRIELSFAEVPDEIAGLTVPRLVLQPIIENAFEHGLKDKLSDGLVTVSFQTSRGVRINGVRIDVADNGNDLDEAGLDRIRRMTYEDEEVGEHSGLANVHRRLRLKFGEGSGLEFGRSHSGGLSASIVILSFPEGVE